MNLTRRSFIGAALAALVLRRLPRTEAETYHVRFTRSERVVYFGNPTPDEDRIKAIIEMLQERNEILEQMQWKESNLLTYNVNGRRVNPPVLTTWRPLGFPPSRHPST